MKVEICTLDDIPDLVKLINSAYRGEDSKQGWTTETDLLDGSKRTDENDLTLQMTKLPNLVFYKCIDENNNYCGCVLLKKEGKRLYLGMLSVSPHHQGAGIGKLLLAEAVNYAKTNDCASIYLTVINLREELIAWYERHGYKKTGELRPFPAHPVFGMPKKPMALMVMEKFIDQNLQN